MPEEQILLPGDSGANGGGISYSLGADTITITGTAPQSGNGAIYAETRYDFQNLDIDYIKLGFEVNGNRFESEYNFDDRVFTQSYEHYFGDDKITAIFKLDGNSNTTFIIEIYIDF